MVPDNPLAEAKQCSSILWYPVVRPHQKVELTNLTHWHLYLALSSKLGEGGRGGGRRGREGGGKEGGTNEIHKNKSPTTASKLCTVVVLCKTESS